MRGVSNEQGFGEVLCLELSLGGSERILLGQEQVEGGAYAVSHRWKQMKRVWDRVRGLSSCIYWTATGHTGI